MTSGPEGPAARTVRVLPDVSGLDKEFDYLVPPALDGRVEVGTSVRVPLHGRRVPGWVVDDRVAPLSGVELRELAAVRGRGPAPEVVATARWAAWRWAGRLAGLLGTASPPRLVDRPGEPGRPPAGPPGGSDPGGPGPDPVATCVGAALVDARAVVRLPPAGSRRAAVDAVAARLRPGGSVLVLAPRAADAGRISRALADSGVPVAVMPDGWAEAAAGGRVVIGSRAGAWAPAPGLAAALVLDAHDEAYREERSPTWSAWEVVAERCRRAGAPCVLTSPCPTLEMLGWGRLHTLGRTDERAGWPAVEVVDRRGDDPRAGLFSARLVDLARNAGRPGLPVVCVLNRKGRARLLACRGCGELVRCGHCGRPLSLVRGEDGGPALLSCPGCGTGRPPLCAHCGSQRLALLRPGVSRVAEELAALVGHPVPEVTADHQDGWADAPVVVGTEAVLHLGRRAGAVAFLDFDHELLAPRFRAAEAALQLLARAARTAGGRGHPLLVQTRLPDHPVLVSAVRADPGLWAAAEQEARRALGLPPFSALALLSGPDAEEAAGELAAAGLSLGRSDQVRAGPEGTGAGWLVRAPDHRSLCDALAAVRGGQRRFRVEVDPLRV